jgi:radical SAM superfamily enzyme YgiQ (UPF0313 family)
MRGIRPAIVLGGPEVSYLPPDAEIFSYADYVIRGDGETSFRLLCEDILNNHDIASFTSKFIDGEQVNLTEIKSAYHLYTDEDIQRKLIYVEASRGCPFGCEFCLSSVDKNVHEFPLDKFLSEIDSLLQRGVKTIKFLDRSINVNVKRLLQIIDYFLDKLKTYPAVVHFEMVPSVFTKELLDAIARFPPGTLRLEIGFQTFNEEVATRIGRKLNPEKELADLRFLREKTNAIIHADLIAGLPGEDLLSFGKGFDRLWQALSVKNDAPFEIQLGILKLLPGVAISRHSAEFAMKYNTLPPYEVESTSTLSTDDVNRLKNFARFWELIINRGLITLEPENPSVNTNVFDMFMTLSDKLLAHFGKNWGIDKGELKHAINSVVV